VNDRVRKPAPPHQAMSGLRRLAHPVPHTYRTSMALPAKREEAKRPSLAEALFPQKAPANLPQGVSPLDGRAK
jgi:hypothetical protein